MLLVPEWINWWHCQLRPGGLNWGGVLWENFDIRADRRSAHTRDKLNHRSRTWVCISSDMYTVFYPVAMLCYPEEKDNCLWWESILSTRFWQDLGKSVGHIDFWNRTLQKEAVNWIFGEVEYLNIWSSQILQMQSEVKSSLKIHDDSSSNSDWVLWENDDWIPVR